MIAHCQNGAADGRTPTDAKGLSSSDSAHIHTGDGQGEEKNHARKVTRTRQNTERDGCNAHTRQRSCHRRAAQAKDTKSRMMRQLQ